MYTLAYIARALFLQLPSELKPSEFHISTNQTLSLNALFEQVDTPCSSSKKQQPNSRKRTLPVSSTQQQHSTKKSARLSQSLSLGASVAIAKEQKSVKLLHSLWRRKYRFNKTHQVVEKFLETCPTAHKVKSIRCLT